MNGLSRWDKDTQASDASALARDWLTTAFRPFWLERAAHPDGGFRERLARDGAPLDEPHSRVRVQARQTFVFAHAVVDGWRTDACRDMTRRGVACLLNACRRADGLFGRRVALGRGLSDDTFELYDTAFAILALAWAARALDEPRLIDEVDATLDALDALKRHPEGGYVETGADSTRRRQNPHMHLCEALLALGETTGRADHLARADGLANLMLTRFVHPSGRLLETFGPDWSQACGPDTVIEPGHEFEWVWLLDRWSQARGADLPDAARQIYAHGVASSDARGLAPQGVRLDGAVHDASRRTWQQTEALKAHLVMHRRGDADALSRAHQTFNALWADYLAPAPRGGWVDAYDAEGRPDAADMTAATGYHLVLAFDELARLTEDAAT